MIALLSVLVLVSVTVVPRAVVLVSVVGPVSRTVVPRAVVLLSAVVPVSVTVLWVTAMAVLESSEVQPLATTQTSTITAMTVSVVAQVSVLSLLIGTAPCGPWKTLFWNTLVWKTPTTPSVR
jgi:hypothetical protein